MPITIKKECPYCNKEFEQVLKNPSSFTRINCSRTCATKTSMKKRSGRDAWSEEELTFLRSLIDKKNMHQICRDWNGVAKRKGWPTRTNEAVHARCNRELKKMGRGIKPQKDNWEMYALARLLDIPNDRVRDWVRKGLPREMSSLHQSAISRKHLVAFVRQNPEQFWGIDPKKLSKVLGDSKLAKHIGENVEQPTAGRAITVIRLDTGDVYRSTFAAACELNVHKQCIRDCCDRDTPLRNGMDFTRLDYPIYWVPLAVRDEFNRIAGGMLYEIYLQLSSVAGYSKTSCLIVAARIAVQVTLIAFRREAKQLGKGELPDTKESSAAFWKKQMVEKLQQFLGMSYNQGFKAVQSNIKAIAYSVFVNMLPNSSHKEKQYHLAEFALDTINYFVDRYLKNSYLPKNYQPNGILENADILTFCACLIPITIERKDGTTFLLTRLRAVEYIRKSIYGKQERLADLSGTGLDDDNPDRAFQYHAQVAASTTEDNTAADTLDDLLVFIEQQVTADKAEQIRMYVDLKLEECSDREIAKVLELSDKEVMAIASSLQQWGKQYQLEAA